MFDPDAAFRVFEAATNEKVVTAEVLSVLLRHLAGTEKVLVGDGPLTLYVPGIGEGQQVVGYGSALHEITGRPIRLCSDEPSAAMADAARQRLSELPFIQEVQINVGDAFAPRGITADHIHVAELSHMLYYAPGPAAVDRILGQIVARLAGDGVACLTHNASGSNIMETMARYSTLGLPDPAPVVEQTAENLGLPLFAFTYDTVLSFGDTGLLAGLTPSDTTRRADVARAARLVEGLCQRSLGELSDLGLLDAALEDVRTRVDSDGRLAIRDHIQIVPSHALASKEHARAELAAAVAQVAALAPEIGQRNPPPAWDLKGGG